LKAKVAESARPDQTKEWYQKKKGSDQHRSVEVALKIGAP
jgi:hypothetical protein